MICENCGQRLTLVSNDEYWAIKYQGGEGLIDGDTKMCRVGMKGDNWYWGPHKPSKSSIINAILKEI